MSLLTSVSNTVSAPLTEQLDVKHLFLLTGLVIIFTMMWAFILAHIRAAVQEIL